MANPCRGDNVSEMGHDRRRQKGVSVALIVPFTNTLPPGAELFPVERCTKLRTRCVR